jgi:Na+-driven multidrug efflux pump
VADAAVKVSVGSTVREIDREVWEMAWPAMLSLVVVNVVDIVDVALIGHLGRQTVAAWGYAAQCINLIETLVQSVGIGCVALMARAIGARDPERARRVMAASVFLSQGVAVTGVLLTLLVPRQLLTLLDAAPDVIDAAVPYFRLIAAAMVLYGAAFMFESGLRANKNTRSPMRVAVVVMTVKVALSLLLIFGALGFPRLGLAGAGIATIGAHAVELLLYLVIARSGAQQGLVVTFGWTDVRAVLRRLFPEPRPRDGRTVTGVFSEVLFVALPSMAERLVMSLALLTYFKILSGYGTAAIAAYAIGVRLLSLSWVPGVALGAAASALVGQALGAGESALARRIAFRAVRVALLVMSVLGVAFIFLRQPMARAFTNDVRVAADLTPFMFMLALAQPFMGTHFTLGGVLRGAGDTVTPLFGAAVGNLGFRVPIAWVSARVLGLPLAWVWSALVFDHLARLTINGSAFLRGNWARRTGASVRRHSSPALEPVAPSPPPARR